MTKATAKNTTIDDLHAWSIYRQNLNSDFIHESNPQSGLPLNYNSSQNQNSNQNNNPNNLPYGNFQLRAQTVESILNHPRLGGTSELFLKSTNQNVLAYLKFGLPRIFPHNLNNFNSMLNLNDTNGQGKRSKSETDLRMNNNMNNLDQNQSSQMNKDLIPNRFGHKKPHPAQQAKAANKLRQFNSESNLLFANDFIDARNQFIQQSNPATASKRPQQQFSDVQSTDSNSIIEISPEEDDEINYFDQSQHTIQNNASRGNPTSGPGENKMHLKIRDLIVATSDIKNGVSSPNCCLTCCSRDRSQMMAQMNQEHFLQNLLLSGINMDLYSGEIMAILGTNSNFGKRGRPSEGRILLDFINSYFVDENKCGGSPFLCSGQIALENKNGVKKIPTSSIKVSYIRHNDHVKLFENSLGELTPFQCMNYFSQLYSNGSSNSRNKEELINSILDELALIGSCNSLSIDELTLSERKRLALGVKILLEPNLLLIDDPLSESTSTTGHKNKASKNMMDIFDTFFLVDFLRRYVKGSLLSRRGISSTNHQRKMSIITLHPPTFEIFSMFDRITLLTSSIGGGKLVYTGHRKEMIPYFTFIEYPCPIFKNPSDYYIDLVTLDDLSSEAYLESSQRIETLVQCFQDNWGKRFRNGGKTTRKTPQRRDQNRRTQLEEEYFNDDDYDDELDGLDDGEIIPDVRNRFEDIVIVPQGPPGQSKGKMVGQINPVFPSAASARFLDERQPQQTPCKSSNFGFFKQLWSILMLTFVYPLIYFPWKSFQKWILFMILATGSSLLVGTIYWNVRNQSSVGDEDNFVSGIQRSDGSSDQNNASDRIGQHWTLMVLTPWPILLILVHSKTNKRHLYDSYQSKTLSAILNIFLEIPFILSIILAYIVPAYLMSGINSYPFLSDDDQLLDNPAAKNIYTHIGLMVLYMYAIYSLLLASLSLSHYLLNGVCTNFACLTKIDEDRNAYKGDSKSHSRRRSIQNSSKSKSIYKMGLMISLSSVFVILPLILLSGGYTIHSRDISSQGNSPPLWVTWVKYLSPVSWLLSPIVNLEFNHDTGNLDKERRIHLEERFECPKNPVFMNQESNIIVRVNCGIENGRDALNYYSLNNFLILPSYTNFLNNDFIPPIWINIVSTFGIIFITTLTRIFLPV